MTDNTCSTSQSKPIADRMSTTTARFREIDKILNNQNQSTAKHEQMSSDRISQMERQLHRITDMEGKLHSVQQEFSTRLDDFEGKVLSSMTRQIHSSGEALESMNAAKTGETNVGCVQSHDRLRSTSCDCDWSSSRLKHGWVGPTSYLHRTGPNYP
jgi:hypothetical protein